MAYLRLVSNMSLHVGHGYLAALAGEDGDALGHLGVGLGREHDRFADPDDLLLGGEHGDELRLRRVVGRGRVGRRGEQRDVAFGGGGLGG